MFLEKKCEGASYETKNASYTDLFFSRSQTDLTLKGPFFTEFLYEILRILEKNKLVPLWVL